MGPAVDVEDSGRGGDDVYVYAEHAEGDTRDPVDKDHARRVWADGEVETGHDGETPTSVAESEYAPCACSPLGKLSKSWRPHAPGAATTPTSYTYDGRGRTLTVTLPDGSVTRYDYTGNTTKVTDAAGKWKKQTTDAMGNLTTVTEPNPAGGTDWTTSYTYDVINHLTKVQMPRPNASGSTFPQERSFAWSVGPYLGGYLAIGPEMVSDSYEDCYPSDGGGSNRIAFTRQRALGVIRRNDGTWVAFSILVNNYNRRRRKFLA